MEKKRNLRSSNLMVQEHKKIRWFRDCAYLTKRSKDYIVFQSGLWIHK